MIADVVPNIGAYRVFIRNAFLEMLAYRMRYVTGIMTYLLFVSVNYFIWQAVYAQRPIGEMIHGFTLSDMVTYICVGWVARTLYFSNIDYDIDEMVRTGQVSIMLLRPVNFQMMLISKAFGELLFRAAFFTLPVGIFIFSVFHIQWPANALDLFCFVVSLLTSFFVLAEINFILGLLAFSLKSINGIIRAKYYLVQLFSGLLLPINFFPDWARVVLEVLPFRFMTYVPLQLYLGKIPNHELPALFLSQLLWVVGLHICGHLMWRKAAAKLTVQGG